MKSSQLFQHPRSEALWILFSDEIVETAPPEYPAST